VLGYPQEFLGGVKAPVDPVCPAGKCDMAVAVDQPSDHGAAGRVDDIDVGPEVRLIIHLPDPRDAVVVDQDADAELQVRAASVSECGVTVQGACHAVTMAWPARAPGRVSDLICPMWTVRDDGFEPLDLA
jgi:hypothetical protein